MVNSASMWWNQPLGSCFQNVGREILCWGQRDRERRPYTPCGPASWTMGTDNLKLCTIGKKIFCTGPTGSADQFFMLPLPSKIHRLNSVSTGNEPINILWISKLTFKLKITKKSNFLFVHRVFITGQVKHLYIIIYCIVIVSTCYHLKLFKSVVKT
jgi:hypothetical protein